MINDNDMWKKKINIVSDDIYSVKDQGSFIHIHSTPISRSLKPHLTHLRINQPWWESGTYLQAICAQGS